MEYEGSAHTEGVGQREGQTEGGREKDKSEGLRQLQN